MVKDSIRDPRKSVPAPAGYLRLLLQRFAPTPALRAQLLEGTDVDERQLKDPGAEVTLFTFVTFSDNLTRVVGEDWPLQALSVWGTASQGALDVAVRSAATIGDGIEILKRFGHVRGPYLVLGLKRNRHQTMLTLSTNVSMSAATTRATTETAAMSARSMLETVLGPAMSELVYHFPWRKPAHAERMRAVLGGALKFEQPHCAIVFPNALCEQPSPYADAGLLATTLADLENAAGRISNRDVLVLKIDRLLKRKRTGRLNEDDAARELGLSRRTLVRRLAESGTSFRTLLDANLSERARQMLAADKLSRDEMAEALGFDDPTSFSRACRRWFKNS